MTHARAQDAVGAVVAALRDLRVHPVRAEVTVHEAVKTCLRAAEIAFEHEVRLASRCRVDFLTASGVAIEVKRGKPNGGQVGRQVDRYRACEAVRAIVLVTERSLPFLRVEEEGKPVRVVTLVQNWGIAL